MMCSAVCPAIFTPEWTMSPQVCTRVPPAAASSNVTHCASTTPSEWSIQPTFRAGWQLVITWLTTGSRLHDFDLQPAPRFPGLAFAPVHLPVNVRKFVPTPPVGENLPGALPAGLGGDTILKSKHNLSALLF